MRLGFFPSKAIVVGGEDLRLKARPGAHTEHLNFLYAAHTKMWTVSTACLSWAGSSGCTTRPLPQAVLTKLPQRSAGILVCSAYVTCHLLPVTSQVDFVSAVSGRTVDSLCSVGRRESRSRLALFRPNAASTSSIFPPMSDGMLLIALRVWKAVTASSSARVESFLLRGKSRNSLRKVFADSSLVSSRSVTGTNRKTRSPPSSTRA